MKKCLLLLFICILVFVGCQKETTETTFTPTDTPIPTPTEIVFNTTCAMCGRIAECQEVVIKRYDTDLATNVDKVFYICDNCYPTVETSINEFDIYYSVIAAYEKYRSETKGFQHVFHDDKYRPVKQRSITFDTEGVHFDFGDEWSDKVANGIMEILGNPNLLDFKTSGETYEIIFYNKNNKINTDSSPIDILTKLKDH